MCGLSSLQYSEVRCKIAPPFEHLKIKIIPNLMSLDVVSGVKKCSEICLRPVLCPAATGGSYSAPQGPPVPLAGLKGVYF